MPTQNASPEYITPGPDGNLWFTEGGANQVGKIDPSGTGIVEYPIPGTNYLGAITAGGDGNLWFLTNTNFGGVGKITTSGVVTEYVVGEQNYPSGLIAGGDGGIWLPQFYPNRMARVSASGVVSEVPLTTSNSGGNGVAVGSDGKLWVAETSAGRMGRLSAISGTGKNFTATHGVPFHGETALFQDGTPTSAQSDFSATVDWGDSTQSAGTVAGPVGGPFRVKGTHTYGNAGSYEVVVTLHDNVDDSDYKGTKGQATVQ